MHRRWFTRCPNPFRPLTQYHTGNMSDSAEVAGRIAELMAQRKVGQDALLPLLQAFQAERGYIDEETVRAIALVLNLSRAEVHGVVSFYHDFPTQPPERPVVKLCRAEACQARGAEILAAGFTHQGVALEPVYCLGLCSVGPNALVGDQVHARLDAAKLAALAEAAQ